jgi:hypothetical protein
MKETEFFREQARECRKHVGQAETPADRRALRQLAEHYDREARKLEAGALSAVH